MDKRSLNLEIILCRPVVKKAKVCVIRKLLKQVKILRSCKNEALKEKKFRKASRIIAEIHAIKTLRPDYVTKCALITENYIVTDSKTKLKRRRNACAKVAKHWDLLAKINAIRNKFVNWREELPPLLKKAKNKSDTEAGKESENGNEKETEDLAKCNKENIVIQSEEGVDESGDELFHKEQKEFCDNGNVVLGGVEISAEITKKTEESTLKTGENAVTSLKFQKARLKSGLKSINESKQDPQKSKLDKKEIVKNNNDREVNGDAKPEEKIDDPFFIGKKIIVPKLLQIDNENDVEGEKTGKRNINKILGQEFRPGKRRKFNDGPKTCDENQERQRNSVNRQTRKEQTTTEDELHPSWKAKKMQATLKPFQGKKIIFD